MKKEAPTLLVKDEGGSGNIGCTKEQVCASLYNEQKKSDREPRNVL